MSAITAGITITNLAKCAIPILFLNKKPYYRVHTFLKVIMLITGAFIAYFYLVYFVKNSFQHKEILDPVSFFLHDIRHFINFEENHSIRLVPEGTSYLDAVVTYFYGSPLFFPRLFTTYMITRAGKYPALWISIYDNWIQYGVLIIITSILIISFIRNRNNRIILFVSINFLIDILLHVVLRWALYDSFIFGSHWVFLVPIFLGWLYNTIQEGQKKILDVVIVILSVFIILNNLQGMAGLFRFAVEHYGI